MCIRHHTEQIIRYCCNCDKSLCAECLICENHLNHNIVRIDIIEQETLNSLVKCQQKLSEHYASVDSSWNTFLAVTYKSYDTIANDVKKTIHEHAENICRFVTSEAKILKQQVDNECAQKKLFAAALESHSSKVSTLKQLLHSIDNAFSASLEDRVQICRKAEAQTALATESTPNWYLQVPELEINFEPSFEFRQLTSLGAIKVGTSKPKQKSQLFVKAMDGRSVTVFVNLDKCVKDVELQIESKTDIPADRLLFSYGGRNIDKNIPLHQYGIQRESTLQMHVKYSNK